MSSHKVAIGSIIMVAKRWSVRLLSLVSTMILARLLLPTDFGLLALVLSFTVLLESLTEFNFDLALVRREKVDDTHFNTAWSLNVIGNSAVALVLIAAAPFFAGFARAPEATIVMQAVALCIFIDGLQNIGMVAWRRQMRFTQEFHLEFWRKISEVSVAVLWAHYWPSVWALVGGMFFGRLIGLGLSYGLHPFRPRFSLLHWREMVGFSGLAVGYGLATRLAVRSDYFLISRLQSLNAVGLYANAQVIATLPSMELARPIGVALFSGFSAVLNDPPRLREAYLKALSGMLLLALPMAVGLAFVAEAAVRILLGEKWMQCTELLRGLALVQIAYLSAASSVSLLMALNKMKSLLIRAIASVIYRPVIMYATLVWFGFSAVPYAVFIAVLIQINLDAYAVRRALNFSTAAWLKRTWRPYVATALMALALWCLLPDTPLTTVGEALIRVAVAIAIAAPVYVVSALSLWHLNGHPAGVEEMVVYALRQCLSRK